MDITVTSTGKTFYQIDNALAALLLEAFPASFERVNPRPMPKPEQPVATWGVNVNAGGYHYVCFSLLGSNYNYDGPPSQMAQHFAKLGAVVPDYIMQEYTPQWKPRQFEHPSVAAANRAEYAAIHNKERK